MVLWEIGLKFVAVLKKIMSLLLQAVNYIFLKMQIGKNVNWKKIQLGTLQLFDF